MNMKSTTAQTAVSRASVRSSGIASTRPQLPARKTNLRSKVVVRAEAPNGAPVQPKDPFLAEPVVVPKMESWEELMAFSGPVPERVNGRLAMLGFVAAVGAELSTGQTAWTQFANNSFVVETHWLLFAAASIAPSLMTGNSLTEITKAASEKGLPDGMSKFTADVELLNGRAAMVGCAALIIIEGIKGSALF
eukprot:CAMPEP_0197846722 /NCGR_PEP_ID=MMETSP1438-20131217/4149_1 /TAXON_ID=1461541 /ORGANISM="Pterosperma sp., Strain CCMP1384" /LENGTH=191 /DNA_ID=CAMNT_0043458465 /DNA_START=72 /DNA_END=647 /DNA_ORIENTATION=+